MKRILALFLTLVLAFFMILPASAEPQDKIEYELNDDGSITITSYRTHKSELTIPSKIDGYTVTAIGYMAFNNQDFAKVTIPETVTTLHNRAFFRCTKLTEIFFPSSLTTVEEGFILRSREVKKLHIPEDNSVIEVIDGALFRKEDNTLLYLIPGLKTEEYIIPAGTRRIGATAFSLDTKMKTIFIPSSVESIGYMAFVNTHALENIIVEEGSPCFEVVDGVLFNKVEKTLVAFPNADPRTEYVVPEGTTRICASAFSQCGKLVSVVLPDSLTAIEDEAFHSCGKLKEVQCSNNIKTIGDYAFRYCDSLRNIVMPAALESIGEYAFADCDKLETIVLNEGLKSIGDYAFCDSYNLSAAEIPDSVTTIGCSPFMYCKKITSVRLPKSLENIAGGLVTELKNIKSLTLSPENTDFEMIDGVLFRKSDSALILVPPYLELTEYSIPDGTKRIADYAFDYNKSLLKVTIPESVKEIGERAFYKCRDLKMVVIPTSVAAIGDNVFENCDNLTLGVLNDSADGYAKQYGLGTCRIEYSVDDKGVTITGCKTEGSTVVIPDTIDGLPVTGVADRAFAGLKPMKELTLPSTIETFGNNVLEGCKYLERILLPDGAPGIELMNGVLFRKSDNTLLFAAPGLKLKEYAVPAGTEHIADSAFLANARLTGITFPESLLSIGSGAFEGCDMLQQVIVPASVTDIAPGNFVGMKSKPVLTVESGSYAEQYAAENNVKHTIAG